MPIWNLDGQLNVRHDSRGAQVRTYTFHTYPWVPMPSRDRSLANSFFLRLPGSRTLVTLLADKWTIPIVHVLARGAQRPGELRRELTGVSQKMLTQTLRSLERAGIVERSVRPVVPPHVDYSLTKLGRSLHAPVAALCKWSKRHAAELDRGKGQKLDG